MSRKIWIPASLLALVLGGCAPGSPTAIETAGSETAERIEMSTLDNLPSANPDAMSRELMRGLTEAWNEVLPDISYGVVSTGFTISGGKGNQNARLTLIFERPKEPSEYEAHNASVERAFRKHGWVTAGNIGYMNLTRGQFWARGGCDVESCVYDMETDRIPTNMDLVFSTQHVPGIVMQSSAT